MVEETEAADLETAEDDQTLEQTSEEVTENTETSTEETTEGEEQSNAPDEYADFQVTEGVEVNAELLASANPIFKELGLSQEQAQKLVDFQSAQVKSHQDTFNTQVTDWQTASKVDKEFGGTNFDENLSVSLKAVDAYFAPEFKDLLVSTGLGNHPEVIRGFYKIGKLLAEDNPEDGQSTAKGKSRLERMYPSDNAAG